jgi:oxygen-independent coproporphyrinogen III oxidase
MRGLYVHIPFCVKKCWYCDFYSIPLHDDLLDKYLDSLFIEAQKYTVLKFNTLYIGGGTPSLLGPKSLNKLVGNLGRILNIADMTEATVEVNPDSANKEFLQEARVLGINRVSIGIQSLNDTELQQSGRIHNACQAANAVIKACEFGFTNISADIIIGLPSQTYSSLQETLHKLTDIGLTHISVYCLSIDEHTPFAANPPLDLPDGDKQADLFNLAAGYLKGSGFSHYEVSNFAFPGKECQHNLIYWHGGEYIGLGPSAASHLNGRRYRNSANLEQYLKSPQSAEIDEDILVGEKKAEEEAMLRLRLLEEGLDLEGLRIKFGRDQTLGIEKRLDQMVDQDKTLIRTDKRYKIPDNAVLISNQVFVNVIS